MNKSVLFITRTYGDAHGGMQTYARTLDRGLRVRTDLDVDACVFRGSLPALPVFFGRALITALFMTKNTLLLGDAVLSPILLFMTMLRPRVQRTVIVHGLDLTWRFPLYRLLIGFCLRRAHRIVAVSRSTAAIAAGLGIPSERMTVIPCPVPPADAAHVVRTPYQLLLLGRLIPRKGTQWFLRDVLPLLLAEHPHLTVLVAGDGRERAPIDALLRHSPHASSVRMLGAVSDAEKQKLLLTSALLVVPNVAMEGDTEGFGIVCLEAGVRGLPTVAAAIDGLPDAVIDGVSGRFFQSGSAEDCARVILSALATRFDEDLMRRAILERFDPSVIASRFIADAF